MLLPLAACGGARQQAGGQPAATPGERIGDPAIAAAIGAPIMSDPGLAQASNANTIRPPTIPDPLSVPPDPAPPPRSAPRGG